MRLLEVFFPEQDFSSSNCRYRLVSVQLQTLAANNLFMVLLAQGGTKPQQQTSRVVLSRASTTCCCRGTRKSLRSHTKNLNNGVGFARYEGNHNDTLICIQVWMTHTHAFQGKKSDPLSWVAGRAVCGTEAFGNGRCTWGMELDDREANVVVGFQVSDDMTGCCGVGVCFFGGTRDQRLWANDEIYAH